ncbi:uncharacterized protein SCHCODRAFT_02637184 [Schizophyllum commune H4-8]|nr:uncharacterized protein SCHCODRAFT_02637184 [Schizophyllum commune H4-8]KAI5888601.1 hypothetical protein SCHCODRAFT_02637184 [Schizophyllum commune H4-8]
MSSFDSDALPSMPFDPWPCERSTWHLHWELPSDCLFTKYMQDPDAADPRDEYRASVLPIGFPDGPVARSRATQLCERGLGVPLPRVRQWERSSGAQLRPSYLAAKMPLARNVGPGRRPEAALRSCEPKTKEELAIERWERGTRDGDPKADETLFKELEELCDHALKKVESSLKPPRSAICFLPPVQGNVEGKEVREDVANIAAGQPIQVTNNSTGTVERSAEVGHDDPKQPRKGKRRDVSFTLQEVPPKRVRLARDETKSFVR